ncbi:glycosyltransferase family 4 protein [Stieleria sp. ICT_E10.1]|uniref:glycosyltransferase family 4 protein n=1 Tax=Stieleria sedimenti TaxID=2976331 RepID=UPI00217F7D36|nr:glycosyltransferase family 4 protein [Stieleria sedimenti]MCS7465771.1 glycosyltransferase family 4 protein [Stieleria sedimenti]
MILLAHPTGNNFFREAAMAFFDAHCLAELHLGIAACGGNSFARLAALPGVSEIRRRTYDARLREFLHLHPWRETARLLAERFGGDIFLTQESGLFCVDAVYRSFDKAVARRVASDANRFAAVYCYEAAALNTFRAAKQYGLRCIYDLPIAHWRTSKTLLTEEAERLPEWEKTLVGNRDSQAMCDRKDAELELADAVVCPSEFVKDSLRHNISAAKPVHVIPFGSPIVDREIGGAECRGGIREQTRPLKVLFAGGMTQRKGLADLFKAMQLLDPKRFELHVMGSPIAGLEFYYKQYPAFIYHATRPHHQVLQLMRSMDVFVLPSIVEGRAQVQQEALACGLPIIVTRNAGAEDLVEDGRAGFLVPFRSPEAIASKLETLERDRDLLFAMSQSAVVKAAEVSWKSYREQLVAAVQDCTDLAAEVSQVS